MSLYRALSNRARAIRTGQSENELVHKDLLIKAKEASKQYVERNKSLALQFAAAKEEIVKLQAQKIKDIDTIVSIKNDYITMQRQYEGLQSQSQQERLELMHLKSDTRRQTMRRTNEATRGLIEEGRLVEMLECNERMADLLKSLRSDSHSHRGPNLPQILSDVPVFNFEAEPTTPATHAELLSSPELQPDLRASTPPSLSVPHSNVQPSHSPLVHGNVQPQLNSIITGSQSCELDSSPSPHRPLLTSTRCRTHVPSMPRRSHPPSLDLVDLGAVSPVKFAAMAKREKKNKQLKDKMRKSSVMHQSSVMMRQLAAQNAAERRPSVDTAPQPSSPGFAQPTISSVVAFPPGGVSQSQLAPESIFDFTESPDATVQSSKNVSKQAKRTKKKPNKHAPVAYDQDSTIEPLDDGHGNASRQVETVSTSTASRRAARGRIPLEEKTIQESTLNESGRPRRRCCTPGIYRESPVKAKKNRK